VLLVLDAGTGQNAISQAKQFNQTVELTGLALTKLDGTAKGGVIFALAKQFGCRSATSASVKASTTCAPLKPNPLSRHCLPSGSVHDSIRTGR
jgi:fused signal recognition particle receptor